MNCLSSGWRISVAKLGVHRDLDRFPASAGNRHACLRQQGAKPSREESAKATSSGTSSSAKAKVQLAVTPEREAAVMTFVGRNHPELSSLLDLLKVNQPKEYERADSRTLSRDREVGDRARARPRTIRLGTAGLASSVANPVLVARLKMADSDDVRRELKQAIGEQLTARAGLLQHERERVAERLERLDRDLARLGRESSRVNRQAVCSFGEERSAVIRPAKTSSTSNKWQERRPKRNRSELSAMESPPNPNKITNRLKRMGQPNHSNISFSLAR